MREHGDDRDQLLGRFIWSSVTPSACRGVENPVLDEDQADAIIEAQHVAQQVITGHVATLFEDGSETSLRCDSTYDEYRVALSRHRYVALVYRRGMIEEFHCMAHSWYGLAYSVLPVCSIRTFRFIECPWLQVNRRKTTFADGQGLGSHR